VLDTLGIEVSHVRLSRRDDLDRWLGDLDRWTDAERQLREATSAVDLPGRGIDRQEVAREAAF